MKSFAPLLLAIACAVPAGEIRAQSNPSKYINEASDRVGKMVDNAARQGYRVRTNSFFMGGALLQQGKETWVALGTVDLEQNRPYIFLAAGDADSRDVDIQILGPNGDVVAKDDSTAVEASCEYRPTMRGRYTIRMRLYASDNNVACYCIAAMLCK
jgi:hypothetical protein